MAQFTRYHHGSNTTFHYASPSIGYDPDNPGLSPLPSTSHPQLGLQPQRLEPYSPHINANDHLYASPAANHSYPSQYYYRSMPFQAQDVPTSLGDSPTLNGCPAEPSTQPEVRRGSFARLRRRSSPTAAVVTTSSAEVTSPSPSQQLQAAAAIATFAASTAVVPAPDAGEFAAILKDTCIEISRREMAPIPYSAPLHTGHLASSQQPSPACDTTPAEVASEQPLSPVVVDVDRYPLEDERPRHPLRRTSWPTGLRSSPHAPTSAAHQLSGSSGVPLSVTPGSCHATASYMHRDNSPLSPETPEAVIRGASLRSDLSSTPPTPPKTPPLPQTIACVTFTDNEANQTQFPPQNFQPQETNVSKSTSPSHKENEKEDSDTPVNLSQIPTEISSPLSHSDSPPNVSDGAVNSSSRKSSPVSNIPDLKIQSNDTPRPESKGVVSQNPGKSKSVATGQTAGSCPTANVKETSMTSREHQQTSTPHTGPNTPNVSRSLSVSPPPAPNTPLPHSSNQGPQSSGSDEVPYGAKHKRQGKLRTPECRTTCLNTRMYRKPSQNDLHKTTALPGSRKMQARLRRPANGFTEGSCLVAGQEKKISVADSMNCSSGGEDSDFQERLPPSKEPACQTPKRRSSRLMCEPSRTVLETPPLGQNSRRSSPRISGMQTRSGRKRGASEDDSEVPPSKRGHTASYCSRAVSSDPCQDAPIASCKLPLSPVADDRAESALTLELKKDEEPVKRRDITDVVLEIVSAKGGVLSADCRNKLAIPDPSDSENDAEDVRLQGSKVVIKRKIAGSTKDGGQKSPRRKARHRPNESPGKGRKPQRQRQKDEGEQASKNVVLDGGAGEEKEIRKNPLNVVVQSIKKRGPKKKRYPEHLFQTLETDELSALRRAFETFYKQPPSNMRAQANFELEYGTEMTPAMIKGLWENELKPWSDRWWQLYWQFNEEAREKKKEKPRTAKPMIKESEAKRWAKEFHERHGSARPERPAAAARKRPTRASASALNTATETKSMAVDKRISPSQK